MDTPEPNTVWPPAPTLPPPEAEKRQPFKLPVPEWIAVTLKESCVLIPIVYGAIIVLDSLHAHRILLQHWTGYAVTAMTMLIFGAIKNWRKYRPSRKKKKSKTSAG